MKDFDGIPNFDQIFGRKTNQIKTFEDYTKIRDIVVKRNKRAVEAGLSAPIHFPTVREIRSGIVSFNEASKAISGFYSGGSQVKAIRQTGNVPEFKSYPELPPKEKQSAEQRKESRRKQQRDYRRRRKVRDTAPSAEQAKKNLSYLKALENVKKSWADSIKRNPKKAGLYQRMIDSLDNMKPSEAQAFVEYMDYRFAQGDFTQKYVIDEFIQDFSRMLASGYDVRDLTDDFDKFLANRAELGERSKKMHGLSSAEVMNLWDEFIGDD